MKIRYSFPVSGVLRVRRSMPALAETGVVRFGLTKSGLVRALTIAFPFPDWRGYQTAEIVDDGAGVPSINIRDYPHHDEAERIARDVEARLTPYGIDGIAIDEPTISMIPENAAEREVGERVLFRRKVGIPVEAMPIAFGKILKNAARPRGQRDPGWDLRMELVRGAWREIRRFEYVKAYFYLFLFVDGLFGKGKIRSRDLEPALSQSVEFRTALRQAMEEVEAHRPVSDPEAVAKIKFLVNLRGHLFHGKSTVGRLWSPRETDNFAGATMLLARTANLVILGREWSADEGGPPAFPYMNDEVSDRYLGFVAGKK